MWRSGLAAAKGGTLPSKLLDRFPPKFQMPRGCGALCQSELPASPRLCIEWQARRIKEERLGVWEARSDDNLARIGLRCCWFKSFPLRD